MARTPVSTYRLQLGPDLTFDEAAARVDYLADLGVTDLYLSPILQAAPGSTHGYDVVDHSRISEAMGGREGFERLVAAARARDLGIVLDIVPNHMAVPTPAYLNRALWSGLSLGKDSPYASWFDVDFSAGQVLMPILGTRIGAVLAAGELTIEDAPPEAVTTDAAGATADTPSPGKVLRYYDHVLPIREGTENLPLTELLDRQHYRLAYWKVADEELNYRRFFDVGTLVALRVEDPEVFRATHALVLELLELGLVDGLRIDHPDGLADPRGYLRHLEEATGGAWTVVEKILEPDETLPRDWPTAGTTGYDAAWRVGQAQIDPAGATVLGALMTELTGDAVGDLPALTEESKREIATTSLAAEVERLAHLVAEECRADVRLRDHTLTAIRDCVRELVVACDRYRAYVVPGEQASPAAVRLVEEWAEHAARGLDDDRDETLALVVDLVLGREVGSAGRTHDKRRAEIIVRFQQVCGAVMAKGVEDTTFYRWTHLTSLTEVGGAPQKFAVAPDELHSWASAVQRSHPATMTLGSTHDSKRGEDVRARIGVLSQLPDAWADLVHALRDATEEARPYLLHGRTENLLWQTLAGTWTPDGPLDADRFTAYLVKASREAKEWTSWTAQSAAGEQALVAYAEHVVASPEVAELMTAWVARTAEPVRTATLATKALQLTLPGVADVYQGTETTTVALVDPDNRRPVDVQHLREGLRRLDSGARPTTLGEEKQRLVAAILRLRRAEPATFVGERAGYVPLPTSTGHAIAFARTLDGDSRVCTVVTRLPVALAAAGGWGEASVVLPDGRWRDVVSDRLHDGGATRLADLLGDSPAVVLAADATDDGTRP
ncbi:maltooligosyl trehalose synthase [Salana multivorans]|uniref:Maltooligosyl trehalose synthase n=1 Tax=Salana multivorans TaxID=120377 RepID=A0A3N2DAE7_9MICO|nr:malto-oligosyltrehalose synthase [Salana multivorans]ROR96608.1 maltooligosyl trehalose synthase [Salana multivorans]